MVSVFTKPDVNTWEVGRTLDKLETTPLRVEHAALLWHFPGVATHSSISVVNLKRNIEKKKVINESHKHFGFFQRAIGT